MASSNECAPEPLHSHLRLPGRSDGILDGFGFTDGRPFDSQGSAGTDFQFVSPSIGVSPSSHRSLKARDGIQEAEARLPSCEVDFRDHLPMPSPHSPEPKQFQIDMANVDPSARQPQPLNREHPEASRNDLPALSMQSASTPPADERTVSKPAAVPADPKAQYRQALRKLAASMRRSEATRRHVATLREILSPDGRQALKLAKERRYRRSLEWLRGQQWSTTTVSYIVDKWLEAELKEDQHTYTGQVN